MTEAMVHLPSDKSAKGADDLSLPRSFEPILRFTEGDLFLPAAVDDSVRCCEAVETGHR